MNVVAVPAHIVAVPAITTVGVVLELIDIFVPLSAPVATGELETTLILYPVPVAVPAGIVPAIVPDVIPVKVPILTGVAKLPAALDN